MKIALTPLSVLLCICASISHAGASVSYIIIEKPHALHLIDRFEQLIPENIRLQQFRPWTPFQIVEEHTTLGDRITPAMRLSHLGQPYLVPSSGKGILAGSSQAGQIQIVRNCTPTEDTILLLKPVSLSRGTSKQNQITVKAKTRCIRLFRNANQWYVRCDTDQHLYGWGNFPTGSFEKWSSRSSINTKFEPALRAQLIDHIDSANGLIKTFYTYLNEKSGKNLNPAQWKIGDETSEKLLFKLEPAHLAQQFKRSTTALSDDLSALLIGTPYHLHQAEGTISISPRPDFR